MKKFVFLIFISICSLLQAQLICKGSICDSVTGKPIEFANIGIVGKGIGTVTNEKGEYHFMVPDSLSKENVKLSFIGYKPKTLPIGAIASVNKVVLQPDALKLDEVAVTAKKAKVKMLGNKTMHQSVIAGFKKNNLGAEMAVRLEINHPQTHLTKFRINIVQNKLQKALFRLNIYSIDEKGYPKENILKENIIIAPSQMTGLVEADLKPYNIFVDEDVFVAIEWIKDLGDATGLMFSTKLVGNSTYFRNASQDKWEKISPIGVGLHVEAAY